MTSSQLAYPICIVANDAGAANLVLGFVKKYSISELRFCLQGPAEKIFRSAYPELENLSLETALAGARSLLSGTSGFILLEHEARRIAAQQGIFSVAVIDHWVNYAERFEREGIEILPNEIWVTDTYALNIAQAIFLKTPLRLMPNYYLKDTLSQIREVRKTDDLRILYLLEPMHTDWERGKVNGEFQALEYFLSKLPQIFHQKSWQMRLRLHPSEEPHKYDSWLLLQSDKRISIDENSLVESMSWSNLIAGCESNAMVLGLLAGRRVVSTLPPWAHNCRLPHIEIELLRELET